MGADVFFTTADGKTANEAFKTARDEAAYESGHGGYTGTIAEKDDFVMCSKETFPSYKEASDFASNLIDNGDERVDDKWGPAGCVKFLSNDKTSYLFFGWASS